MLLLNPKMSTLCAGNSHEMSRMRIHLQEAIAGKSIADDLNSSLQVTYQQPYSWGVKYSRPDRIFDPGDGINFCWCFYAASFAMNIKTP